MSARRRRAMASGRVLVACASCCAVVWPLAMWPARASSAAAQRARESQKDWTTDMMAMPASAGERGVEDIGGSFAREIFERGIIGRGKEVQAQREHFG